MSLSVRCDSLFLPSTNNNLYVAGTPTGGSKLAKLSLNVLLFEILISKPPTITEPVLAIVFNIILFLLFTFIDKGFVPFSFSKL